MNVCGLLSKICIPEFKQYVTSVDVFSCSESHLDDLDVIDLVIYGSFEEINTDCEYVQWFKLSKSVFDSHEDVIFGSVYIPPDNFFRFFKQNMFYSEVEELPISLILTRSIMLCVILLILMQVLFLILIYFRI